MRLPVEWNDCVDNITKDKRLNVFLIDKMILYETEEIVSHI